MKAFTQIGRVTPSVTRFIPLRHLMTQNEVRISRRDQSLHKWPLVLQLEGELTSVSRRPLSPDPYVWVWSLALSPILLWVHPLVHRFHTKRWGTNRRQTSVLEHVLEPLSGRKGLCGVLRLPHLWKSVVCPELVSPGSFRSSGVCIHTTS